MTYEYNNKKFFGQSSIDEYHNFNSIESIWQRMCEYIFYRVVSEHISVFVFFTYTLVYMYTYASINVIKLTMV